MVVVAVVVAVAAAFVVVVTVVVVGVVVVAATTQSVLRPLWCPLCAHLLGMVAAAKKRARAAHQVMDANMDDKDTSVKARRCQKDRRDLTQKVERTMNT